MRVQRVFRKVLCGNIQKLLLPGTTRYNWDQDNPEPAKVLLCIRGVLGPKLRLGLAGRFGWTKLATRSGLSGGLRVEG